MGSVAREVQDGRGVPSAERPELFTAAIQQNMAALI
jgi:hypothetical protein